MRPTAPTPARTQSCLARIVAVARCCGSMHAREVASLVALSSSRAPARMELILRLCQSINLETESLTQVIQCGPDLLNHGFQLDCLLAQSIYDMPRRLGQELLIANL